MPADPGTLAAFNDFMAATRQRPMSGPDKVLNMMTRHQTYLSRVMMSGLKATDYFQDGTEIVEQVQLKYTGNARDYLPTDTQAPTGDDSLVQLKVPWRFKLVHSVWYDHEIILNNGDQSTVFKRLKNVKRQKMYTDFWDSVNDNLWAAPNSSTMEGGNSTGAAPYSLRCFITAQGGAPLSGTAENQDGAAADWSTVETINPTTYTNFKNQVTTYDPDSPETTLLQALDDMFELVNFEAPEENGDKTGMMDSNYNKTMILTSLEGKRLLTKLSRSLNDTPSVKGNITENGKGKVFFNGIEVKRISALDSLFTTGKPKFYFVNFNHIKLIFHKTRFLYPKSFEGTITQPMANAEYRDTWWNLVCTNRREQGMVRAAA